MSKSKSKIRELKEELKECKAEKERIQEDMGRVITELLGTWEEGIYELLEILKLHGESVIPCARRVAAARGKPVDFQCIVEGLKLHSIYTLTDDEEEARRMSTVKVIDEAIHASPSGQYSFLKDECIMDEAIWDLGEASLEEAVKLFCHMRFGEKRYKREIPKWLKRLRSKGWGKTRFKLEEEEIYYMEEKRKYDEGRRREEIPDRLKHFSILLKLLGFQQLEEPSKDVERWIVDNHVVEISHGEEGNIHIFDLPRDTSVWKGSTDLWKQTYDRP